MPRIVTEAVRQGVMAQAQHRQITSPLPIAYSTFSRRRTAVRPRTTCSTRAAFARSKNHPHCAPTPCRSCVLANSRQRYASCSMASSSASSCSGSVTGNQSAGSRRRPRRPRRNGRSTRALKKMWPQTTSQSPTRSRARCWKCCLSTTS